MVEIVTTATGDALRAIAPNATPAVEVIVLTAANLVATLYRYACCEDGWIRG